MSKARESSPGLPFLSVDDIGNEWWTFMFKRTKNDCFDVKKYPAFPKEKRMLEYNRNVYVMPYTCSSERDNCVDDDTGEVYNGDCSCNG